MSFQTFIISQINAINTTLNNLKVNAKRIFELPSQTTLDLSSKIHVSRGGVDEQLELQLLANALQSNTQNRIIGIDGNITVSGNDITIPTVQWSINNIDYSTNSNTVLNSPYCATGLNRKDIIVANNNGLLILVTGVESSGLVVRPNIPLNSLLVTEIDVSDSALGTPTGPFIGISYIKKTDYQPYASNVSGDDAEIVLNPNGYSEIRLTNPLLNSIAGVDVAAAISGSEPPYNGKPFRVRNLTGNSITIKNESLLVTNPFLLNGGADLVFPDNEIIHFIYDASGMIEDVKSFGASVDISGKLDKVETTAAQRRFYAVNTDGNQTVVNESDIAGGGGIILENLTLIHATFFVANSIQNNIGFTITTSSTASDSGTGPVGTGFYSWARRRYISASTAGSSILFANTSFRTIRYEENIGFKAFVKFGNDDVSTVENARNFFGFRSVASIGNVNPSTLTNCFGIGNDSGDENLSIIHNDSSGTATKIDLGSNFPANTNAIDYYTFEYWKEKNSFDIHYNLTNNNNGISIFGTITGDLPSPALYYEVLNRNNGASALEVRLCLSHRLIFEK